MVYRFGDCDLDMDRLELRRAGRLVALEPQVFELLAYLVENRDRAVTRRELYERVWRGRIVTDAALNSRVKAARAAIGDDGKAQLAIRTLHRTGYRFVGEVAESPGGASLDLLEQLEGGGAEAAPQGAVRPGRRARRGLAPLSAALAGALLATTLYWALSRDSDIRWFTDEAVAEIEAYLDGADWESAYVLAKEAEARLPGNAALAELWPRIAWRVTLVTEPAGAMAFRQPYAAAPEGDWELLGTTPLTDIQFPWGLSRVRFTLPGHQPLVRALGGGHLNWRELQTGPPGMADTLLVGPDSTFKLDTEVTLPPDMVRVPGWTLGAGTSAVPLRDFFLGRYEVTNAEYKAFVDGGGYSRDDLWDPVIADGAVQTFERAMRLFVDRTGRPGPSTWQASDYPPGQADFPVSGVSWYEAAAFARFKGRELPTAHHWQEALANSMFLWLLPASNFDGEGPRPVTGSRAMSHIGAYDMTGNVREWTATAAGDEYVILGGSWDDPYYIAGVVDSSASPLDRSPGNGFRLAATHDEPSVAELVRAPLTSRTTASPGSRQEPVTEEVYAAYSRIFDYDRTPLNAQIESTSATHVWVRERIRFDAAYGAEQMLLHLYLPLGRSPPYQTVVYWPGWDTFGLADADEYFAKQLDFIVKSGRAVAFPIYRGTFDRQVGSARVRPDFDTAAYRDNAIDTVKDMRRAIDYLETRSEIAANELAYFGYSWGGVNGPSALAQEPRLRIGVIQIGLLPPMASIPEVDPINALPRVHVPVLMLSGEFDPMVPVANARRYFELLGTPAEHKRHIIAIGGHFIPREVVIRETLDWLDARLGTVAPAGDPRNSD